jgi:hypothetical protein
VVRWFHECSAADIAVSEAAFDSVEASSAVESKIVVAAVSSPAAENDIDGVAVADALAVGSKIAAAAAAAAAVDMGLSLAAENNIVVADVASSSAIESETVVAVVAVVLLSAAENDTVAAGEALPSVAGQQLALHKVAGFDAQEME